MKKVLAIVLVFAFALSLMVCGTTVTAATERAVTTQKSVRTEYYITGDLNDDGEIDNRDLVLLQQFLNDWDVTIHALAADLSGDGDINNRDLVLMQQYLNGWDVELAPSSPKNHSLLS